jgi:hypothetical protein
MPEPARINYRRVLKTKKKAAVTISDSGNKFHFPHRLILDYCHWPLMHRLISSPPELTPPSIKRQEKVLQPIREVWIHGQWFAARRLSMMLIIARRTNAATVVA